MNIISVVGGRIEHYHVGMADRSPVIYFLTAILVLAMMSVKESQAEAPEIFNPDLIRVEVRQSHMGMPVFLRVYAEDEAAGQRACQAAFKRIAELNMVLSDYEPDSELSRLSAGSGTGKVPVSPELLTVLVQAKSIAEQTEGLLDPTAGPVIRVWRKVRTTKQLPDQNTIAESLKHVGYSNLRLDESRREVELTLDDMRLDLGAIAKGYVGDEAIKCLRELGYPIAMFEAGGDMVFGDPPPGEEGWLVKPAYDGLPELRLANTAAAISGNTVQFVEIDGKSYGHIIDPRTGYPITTRHVCLVAAASGLSADPLATLGTIMDETAYYKLLEAHYPDTRAWVVTLEEK